MPPRRPIPLAAAAGAAGLALTAAIIVVPPLHFAYRNPELHLALVTAEALIALLTAVLAVGRFRRTRQASDLLLTAGLGVLSIANLGFAAIPAVFASDTAHFPVWASLLGRVVGACLLATAAIAPPRKVWPGSPLPIRLAVGCAAVLGVIAVFVAVLGSQLPSGLAPGATPDRSAVPRFDSPPVFLVVHAFALTMFCIAAVGFSRRARWSNDPLLKALAVACAIGAVARVNYMIFPSAATPYVYTGDGFRLLSYLVILAGAIAEISSYWRRIADAAAVEERGRIARDLHDGLAQELAAIERNLHYLDPDDRFVGRARDAAERASLFARRALSALSEPSAKSLGDAIADTARTVAAREGAELALDLSSRPSAGPEARDALVAITSEAITNAVRHGGARIVRVSLREEAGAPVLTVRDEGRGFAEPSPGADGHGYGLAGMRARAGAIGAELTISSEPKVGTTVEVRLHPAL